MHPYVHTYRLTLAFAVFALLAFVASPLQTAAQSHNMAGMAASSTQNSGPVVDIVRDPAQVPPSVGDRPATTVKVELVAKEVVGVLDPASGTTYRYWTFNGKVPGPMLRVRQGDMVQVTVRNDPSSHMVHSVDFHAALGPGGGAALSQVVPGQEKTFTFQATTPGLYVYHCGTPMIGDHIANGMYGLILVEPAGGMPHVDHEFYVMQGEIYTAAPKGKPGLQAFSEAKLLQESAEYFVFNGAVDALTKEHPLKANAGETVRLFFGDAGPNATSSFHVVGQIFTKDFQLGSLTSPAVNGVQTASIPAGGAAILELKTTTAGQFAFMDHAMARMAKGLMGVLQVQGEQNAELMHEGPASPAAGAQPAAAAPTAEIIAPGDMDPAAASSEASAVPAKQSMDDMAGMDSMPGMQSNPTGVSAKKNDSMHGMGCMKGMHANHPAQAAREAQPAETAAPTINVAEPQPSPTTAKTQGGAQLDGCLTLNGGSPRLALFHSRQSYALEPRPMLLTESPLALAQNDHALVHVMGRFDTATGNSRFIVDSVEQLAASCDTKLSLARLRGAASAARVVKAAAVSTGAVEIGMKDMTFDKSEIVVNVGQQVIWTNSTSAIHNVVADPALAVVADDVHLPKGAAIFNSGYLQAGQTFSHTFTVPGVYRYVCTLHEAAGMKGVIIVKGENVLHMAQAQVPPSREPQSR